jgi:quinol monooxygenase YgiN
MPVQTTVRATCLVIGLLALLVLAPSRSAGEDKDDPVIAFVKPKLKSPDKPFTLVVLLKVKEGAGEKFEAAMTKAVKASRKEKGCIRYELNRDTEDPLRYQVYERWKSLADLEAHIKSEHFKALRSELPEISAGAPELHVMLPASE